MGLNFIEKNGWIEFDVSSNQPFTMYKWCHATFGQSGILWDWSYGRIKFRNMPDATLFLLKWVNHQ